MVDSVADHVDRSDLAGADAPGRNAGASHGTVARVGSWWRRNGGGRKAVIVLLTAGTLSGILTFLALTGTLGVTLAADTTLALLVLDLVLLLSVGVLVSWGLVRLWAMRRAGAAGARLHVRLVMLFGFLAVAPAIILMVLSALFFNFEVRTWFNDRVRTAVTESVQVAEAYLAEHRRVITADALAMANDLNRQWPGLIANERRANNVIETQAALRALSEALVFDGTGRILGRTGLSFSLELSLPTREALAQAANGEVVFVDTDADDRVRALVGLDTVPSAFLYVGRFVDPAVLQHMERTQQAAREYEQLELRRSGLQLTLASIFVLVSLLLLMTAVAIGLNFANRLARPITGLVGAAERVRAGDLDVHVPELNVRDEFGTLTRAFNRMVRQLAEQQKEVLDANQQLDKRRRFTEGVLSGVKAGVLGLDATGAITYPNHAAAALLERELDWLIGRNLVEAMPAAADLMARIQRRPERMVDGQVNLASGDGPRMLLVRISADLGTHNSGGVIGHGDTPLGYIVTFDDVTELLSAQRKAAWADVARRIAHEIRNPLTPIQLSAERLKRKYLKEIKSDPETFVQCTDTIVRQVGDIGRMVEEFSAFARMPAPVMRDEDLRRICQEAAFLQRNAHRDVSFTLSIPEQAVMQRCDRRLVAQALTNLLQNAVDAMDERHDGDGEVRLELITEPAGPCIVVADNGKGLPDLGPDELTEPYVTTREKGTGLGLAIVKKIMEDHGGELVMGANDPAGARIVLKFRVARPADARPGPAATSKTGA